MMKSVELDKEGVIWKEVRQEAEWAKAEEYLEAKQTFSRDPLDFVDKDQDKIDDRVDRSVIADAVRADRDNR
jgi:hypothetical protein